MPSCDSLHLRWAPSDAEMRALCEDRLSEGYFFGFLTHIPLWARLNARQQEKEE